MTPEELLIEFLKSDYYDIVLKELRDLSEALSNDVLKLSLDSTNDRELLIKKARSEGSDRLVGSFIRRLQSLKSRKTDGN